MKHAWRALVRRKDRTVLIHIFCRLEPHAVLQPSDEGLSDLQRWLGLLRTKAVNGKKERLISELEEIHKSQDRLIEQQQLDANIAEFQRATFGTPEDAKDWLDRCGNDIALAVRSFNLQRQLKKLSEQQSALPEQQSAICSELRVLSNRAAGLPPAGPPNQGRAQQVPPDDEGNCNNDPG